jgi:hypothetical protein
MPLSPLPHVLWSLRTTIWGRKQRAQEVAAGAAYVHIGAEQSSIPKGLTRFLELLVSDHSRMLDGWEVPGFSSPCWAL